MSDVGSDIRGQNHERSLETKAIKLSEEQWATFMEVIENPPPPTPALIAAFRTYMQSIVDGRLVTDTTGRAEALAWLASRSPA